MLTTLLTIFLACDGGGEASHEPASAPAAPAAAASAPAAAPAAAPASAPSQAVYAGRFASDPLLTPQQVALIPPDELRLVRNEVYARHGRPFKSEDLQAHFKATGWYQERADYSDSLLTQHDLANAALIQSFEGDTAKQHVLSRGEYSGDDGVGVAFTDATAAEVMDGSGDIYNWTRESRHWVALGEWVVTWEGGSSTWRPTDTSMRKVQLWRLNHSNGSVVEVFELTPQQG